MLIGEIRFAADGNSTDYVTGADCGGWAPPELTHRWSVGGESRVRLPICRPGPGCVIVIDAKPWTDAEALPEQVVMLAINGRLLASVSLGDQRALAFTLPAQAEQDDSIVLGLTHLSAVARRPNQGTDRNGRPLGLLLINIRVYRLTVPDSVARVRQAVAGQLSNDSL